MKHRILPLVLGLAALAGGWAGCSSLLAPQPDPSQFYVLTPLPTSAAPATPPFPDTAIGVFSPDIPSYLDRPQMVTRVGPGQVSLNEFQRWAEPLGASIAGALVQDISVLAGTPRVALFPQTRVFGQEFEVYAMVFQFDGPLTGGNVTLQARWRITGPSGKPNYVVRESTFSRPAGATLSYPAYVQTLSDLVGDMAKEIVAAIPDAQKAEQMKKDEDAKDAAKAAADAAAAEAATKAAVASPAK